MLGFIRADLRRKELAWLERTDFSLQTSDINHVECVCRLMYELFFYRKNINPSLPCPD
jgi:hypothetical protein